MKIQNPSSSTNGIALTRIETQFPPLSFSTLNRNVLIQQQLREIVIIGQNDGVKFVAVLVFAVDVAGGAVQHDAVDLPVFHFLHHFRKLRLLTGRFAALEDGQTRTTRHRMISHRTAFRTLEFMTSPTYLLLL